MRFRAENEKCRAVAYYRNLALRRFVILQECLGTGNDPTLLRKGQQPETGAKGEVSYIAGDLKMSPCLLIRVFSV